jgi:predicted nucleic-acid-binding protein
MIGVDTNILVRLLTGDDKKQSASAAHLIENNIIFIPKSVLLETEWVLRYAYKLEPATILIAFEKLLGHENITVEATTLVAQALQWYEQGFDFADALHLATSHTAKQFATFDKIFIKKAKKVKVNLITPEEV